MTADKPGFLEELKRRHVVRVAIAYAVAAWLLVQVATQVFPFFNIPGWAVRLIVVVLAIGFPVAVAFAWVFEMTPEGLRRTEPSDSPDARAHHETRQVGRKLNAVIVAVLAIAVALLGWRVLVLRHAPVGNAAPALTAGAAASGRRTVANATIPAPASSIPEKSIAVLPFDSGDKTQKFFSDGLSEDLITALSQFPGLKVISRDSAFQFRDSADSSQAIGKKLGVAHLLEGSVRRQNDEVRISAELVNAADGSIAWSQHYDKPYKDLFALQDAIAKAVADALKAKLLTAQGAVLQSERPPSGNLAAYTAYLRGSEDYKLGTESSIRNAIAAFEQATRLDPNYAAAWTQLSSARVDLATAYLGGAPAQQAYSKARAEVARALALDPDLAQAHLTRSWLLQMADRDWGGAEAEARRALQLAPNDAQAKFYLGTILATLGQAGRAAELTRQGLQADPRSAIRYTYLAIYLTGLGRLDEARQAIHTAIALHPGADSYHEQLAVIEILAGQPQAALAAAQQESSRVWREIALALALQIGPDRKAADAALQGLIAKYADLAPYQIAQVYALRKDPDAMFQWLDRAWTSRDPGIGYLLSDPFILRYRHDPRFAAFCKKVGLPTTTDAVAMK